MPRLRSTLLGLVAAGAVAVPFSSLRDDPTVAHWRFQEGVKGFPAPHHHVVLDASGNDRHGVAIGGPVYRPVVTTRSNLALAFDGQDDRVFVPDDRLFHLTESLTLEAFVRIDRYPGSAAKLSEIVHRGDQRAGFDPFFLAVGESGQLVFLVADALNRACVLRSPQPLPIGEWVHVAGTLDHGTGVMRVFVGGECVAMTETEVRGAGVLGGATPGVGIGDLQTRSGQALRGAVAEVRISRAALTPTQFIDSGTD